VFFFNFGGAGVDIFFVLSGFIITYTSKKALASSSNYGSFLKRRAIRIFPTYWIIISGFLLLQILLPTLYRTHYQLNAVNLLSTYLLLPDHIMVNGVSWTLSYELFFYFLFSFAFLIRNKLALLILSCIYVLCIIAMPLLHIDMGQANGWIKMMFHPMNVEFFIGVAIVFLLPAINKSTAIACICFGTAWFIAGALYANSGHALFGSPFNRVVLFGVPSFFIIMGIVKYEIAAQVNVHSILVSLGEASYSLYLIHLPLVFASIKILARLHISSPLVIHILIMLVVIMICAISIFFFKWVEKPMINKLNSAK